MADTDAGFIVIDTTKVSKVPLIKETLIKSDFVIAIDTAQPSLRGPQGRGNLNDEMARHCEPKAKRS